MKKIILVLSLILFPVICYADDNIPLITAPVLDSGVKTDWNTLAQKAVDLLLWFGGFAAVAVFAYGAVQMIISAGDESKVESGKKAMVASIVGLVIIGLAWGIVAFINSLTK